MTEETQAVMEKIALGELVEAGIEWDVEPTGIAEVDARVDALLAALGKLKAEVSQNCLVAKQRMDQIAAWLGGENDHLQRSIEFITRKIQDLTRTYDFGRKRSRSLPSGSFGYRKSIDRLELLDPPKVLEFVKANGLSVRVKESVDLGALLDHVKATGEVPEGAEFKRGADTFYAKPRENGDG